MTDPKKDKPTPTPYELDRWVHKQDMRDYFDGKFEADLGLHGSSMQPGTPSSDPERHHPHAREAHKTMLRIEAAFGRMKRADVITLACYYSRLRPADRNGFRAPIIGREADSPTLMHVNVLPLEEENLSRVALLTARARLETKRAKGDPEEVSQVREAVRALRDTADSDEAKTRNANAMTEIIGEAQRMLARAQDEYDTAVVGAEAAETKEARRAFLDRGPSVTEPRT